MSLNHHHRTASSRATDESGGFVNSKLPIRFLTSIRRIFSLPDRSINSQDQSFEANCTEDRLNVKYYAHHAPFLSLLPGCAGIQVFNYRKFLFIGQIFLLCRQMKDSLELWLYMSAVTRYEYIIHAPFFLIPATIVQQPENGRSPRP